MSESPWTSVFYLQEYEQLVQALNPMGARTMAFARSMFGDYYLETLAGCAISTKHNELLLRILKQRSGGFACLLEILRAQLFGDMASRLERALEPPPQPLRELASTLVPSHDGGSQMTSSADPSSSVPAQTSEKKRSSQLPPEAEESQAQCQSMSSTDSGQLDEQGTTVHELEALRSGNDSAGLTNGEEVVSKSVHGPSAAANQRDDFVEIDVAVEQLLEKSPSPDQTADLSSANCLKEAVSPHGSPVWQHRRRPQWPGHQTTNKLASFHERTMENQRAITEWCSNLPSADDIRRAARKFASLSDTTRVRRVQIYVLGRYGSGKTDFCRALRGQPFIKNEKSTMLLTVEHQCVLRGDRGMEDTSNTPAHYLAMDLMKLAQLEKAEREANTTAAAAESVVPVGNGQLKTPPPLKSRLSTVDTAAQEQSPTLAKQQPTAEGAGVTPSHGMEKVTPVATTLRQLVTRTHHSSPEAIRQAEEQLEDRNLWGEFVERLATHPEDICTVPDDDTIISVFDSGGLSVFSSLLHMFMGSRHAVYVICLNATETLNATEARQEYRLGHDVESIYLQEKLTNLDHIKHWMTAVYLSSKKSTKKCGEGDSQAGTTTCNSSTQSSPQQPIRREKPAKVQMPPVILVATHADRVQEECGVEVAEQKSLLWEGIREGCSKLAAFKAIHGCGMTSADDPKNLVMVDNTKSGIEMTEGIVDFCKRIQSAVDKIVNEPTARIKRKWVRFEYVLKYLQEQEDTVLEGKGYVTRTRICQLAKMTCNIDAQEVEEVLQYYHNLRRIVYTKNNKDNDGAVVIFDILWMVKKVVELLFCERYRLQVVTKYAKQARRLLGNTGILTYDLIEAVWDADPLMRASLLEAMSNADLLYGCDDFNEPGARFFVPSVLTLYSDKEIVEEIRQAMPGADDRLSFSMADVPLLITTGSKVAGTFGVFDEAPLPHSAFVMLLVKLMRLWNLRIDTNRMKVFYNSAWLEIPRSVVKCSGIDVVVRVYLAHFESSGALLVNVQINPRKKSRRDMLYHPETKVSIAEICVRIRCDIHTALLELQETVLQGIDLFQEYVLPLPPTCDCKNEVVDLGNAEWKISFPCGSKLDHVPEIEQRHIFDVAYDCRKCNKEVKHLHNANCWFDKTNTFDFNTPANRKAWEQIKEIEKPSQQQDNQAPVCGDRGATVDGMRPPLQLSLERSITGLSNSEEVASKSVHGTGTAANCDVHVEIDVEMEQHLEKSPSPDQTTDPATYETAEWSSAEGRRLARTDPGFVEAQHPVDELPTLDQPEGQTRHPQDVRSAADKVFDKNGMTTRLRRVNINVCGQFAAGKTSLIDNMMNKQFLPGRASTLIATVSHDVCLRRNGLLEQTNDTPADFDVLEDIARARLDTARAARPPSPKLEVPERPQLWTDQVKERIADDILNDPEIMREVRDTETVMSIWDTGGQSVFSSIQHLFMSDQYIIYLLCFNAAEKLLSEKKQKFHPPPSYNISVDAVDSEEDPGIPLPGRLRNVDHIRHRLTAIHLASGNNDTVPTPPVIVVGTHADWLPEGTDLQQCKKARWEELQRLCKQSPMFNSMDSDKTENMSTRSADTMYLVDNTVSGRESQPSPEVRALYQHIHRASEQLLEGEEVRKEWVRFEWVLQHLRQQEGFPGYTDRRYLAELAEKTCHITDNNDELEKMLLFYDKLRLIIYRPQHKMSGEDAASTIGYDPKEIIVFDMVWLIKQFNDLIFGPKFTGAKKEERSTAELREHLGKTGILGEGLVNKAWKRRELHQDSEINDRLLKVFESWHMLYKCNLNGPVKYVVPCALQVSPERTILERMRKGSGADDDRLVISTADVPLLVLVQPQNYDLYGGEPDTPLPSGTYFGLLVCLMEKWRIEDGPQKVDLQYNSAWLELPPWQVGLPNFVNGRIRVFLAHYEVSGALLLSVKIKHPVGSFEEGHLRTRNDKVKISKVLCRIRGDVVSSLRQLYSDKKLALKLFLVPFPPKCDCSEDGCHANQAQPGVKATDFGYFKWKMPFCGPNPFLSDTGSINPEDETWPGVTCACGCDVDPPDNARAWVCPESEFKLEGKSNVKARRLLDKHRLKSTVAGLDVRPSTTSNSAGAAFVTSSPAELTDQGAASTSTSTSAHTQATSSGTARQDRGDTADVFESPAYKKTSDAVSGHQEESAAVRTGISARSSQSKKGLPSTAGLPEERHGNPWKHARFIETTYSLQEKLTQLVKVRGLCYSLQLIGTESYNQLQLLESKSKHNEKLLYYLMTGDADSFAKFREVMRHLNQEVKTFAKILKKWDTIGPFKEDYQHIERQLNGDDDDD